VLERVTDALALEPDLALAASQAVEVLLSRASACHVWINYSRARRPVKLGRRRARASSASRRWVMSPAAPSSSPAWGRSANWIVDFAFGDVHSRPGLDGARARADHRRGADNARRCEPQLAAHIRALRAIQVGWEQIEEAILQSAPYAGVPRAVNAIKVLRTQQEEDDR